MTNKQDDAIVALDSIWVNCIKFDCDPVDKHEYKQDIELVRNRLETMNAMREGFNYWRSKAVEYERLLLRSNEVLNAVECIHYAILPDTSKIDLLLGDLSTAIKHMRGEKS